MERSADWLRQAQANLAHARDDLTRAYYDWACFSAQQAAEMAVKAVFQRLGAVAWGHAVTELLDELSTRIPVGPDLVAGARELDKTYIVARYPDATPSGAPADNFTLAEAERMVCHAEAIVEFCQGFLAPAEP